MDAPSSIREVTIEQLTPDNFSPYGDVIDLTDVLMEKTEDAFRNINENVTSIDLSSSKGRGRIDVMSLKPTKLPFKIRSLTRHRSSTYTLVPLLFYPYILVVGDDNDTLDTRSLRAFFIEGRQGVNLRPGIWHHAPVAIRRRFCLLSIGHQHDNKRQETHRLAKSLLIAPGSE